jgi:hypothetical protein
MADRGQAHRDAMRERMRAIRAADRAAGLSVRAGQQRRANIDALLTIDRRMVVRAGRHVIGAVPRADGSVLIARVPRSDTWRAVGVVRDRSWNTRATFGPVHACEHDGGHHATMPRPIPVPDARIRRMLDALACTVFGHDPARSLSLDAMRAERWANERAEHERECADCRDARKCTTWNNTRRDDSASVPLTRATRDAVASLASTRWPTPNERERRARERARAVAALDARINARG